MPTAFRHVGTAIFVVLLQWLVLGRLTAWGAYPDIVLLYIALVAIRYGRSAGMIAGFSTGLMVDFLYGTWGMHMFVKTVTGFLIGLFPATERETMLIQPQQAFIGSLVVALMHNGLFVILLAVSAGTRNTYLITALWLGSALYTAVVGFVASMFVQR